MAEIFKFFNSAPGDERWHYASDFADYFGSVLTSGLLHENGSYGLQVTVNSGTLTTNIAIGKALIKGYSYENTNDLTLTHSLPEQTLDRIDRIVLRLDLRNANRFIKAFVKEGVSATNPVAPDLQRDNYVYELSLATVRVRANTSSINVNDTTDTRALESVCGIVQSLITVPTSVFQQQFDAWFDGITDTTEQAFSDWFATIQNTLDGDVATNLANQITIHKTDGTAHGIGDKMTLATTEKSTIVEAINEVKTTVDSKSVVIDRFTDVGTFTWIKPKGVKKVIVSLCGGGGGGTAYFYSGGWTNVNGKAGGVSSFGGYVSASGGTGTGVALADNPITSQWSNGTSYKFGGGAEGFTSYIGTAVQGYGYGGKGSYYNNAGTGYYGVGGGGAQSIIKQSVILDSTVNTVLITIGAGGAGGSSGSTSGDAGKNGCVIVEYLL